MSWRSVAWLAGAVVADVTVTGLRWVRDRILTPQGASQGR